MGAMKDSGDSLGRHFSEIQIEPVSRSVETRVTGSLSESEQIGSVRKDRCRRPGD